MSQLWREPSSFRDPSGYIINASDCVYRSLNRESYELVQAFLQSPAYTDLLDQELLIPTEILDSAVQESLSAKEGLPDRCYVSHEKLWFVNYPYEWTAQMLSDAAQCTLSVQTTLMKHGFQLKDASAYNVHFDFGRNGLTPKFIDLGSIEPLSGTDGIWLPYKQFVSHFLLPLLYNRDMGHDFKGDFLTDLEGLDPEQAYRLLGWLKRLLPRYFTLVTLPHLLRRWEVKQETTSKKRKSTGSEYEIEKALFILSHTVRSLKGKVSRSVAKHKKSLWTDYEQSNTYPAEAESGKREFLRGICEEIRPKSVLDIGCNTGQFSLLAAEYGANVLAIDQDMPSLDRLYLRAREQQSNVLPLRVDISNPSPGIGWNNKERAAFLDRSSGFDCVFSLAMVHHLVVAKGIPLSEVVKLSHNLTNRYLVVELVDYSDPMFQSLVRGRDSLYTELTLENQERDFTQKFTVLRSLRLPEMTRTLHLMEKK